MAERDADYMLRRASEETLKALHADHPAAASVHQDLALHYSARAVTLLADQNGEELRLKLRADL